MAKSDGANLADIINVKIATGTLNATRKVIVNLEAIFYFIRA